MEELVLNMSVLNNHVNSIVKSDTSDKAILIASLNESIKNILDEINDLGQPGEVDMDSVLKTRYKTLLIKRNLVASFMVLNNYYDTLSVDQLIHLNNQN
jgi:hypothetical protein